MGTHRLDSDEMRIICRGLDLVEKEAKEGGTITDYQQKKFDSLRFILFGGRVTIEYHDGGYM